MNKRTFAFLLGMIVILVAVAGALYATGVIGPAQPQTNSPAVVGQTITGDAAQSAAQTATGQQTTGDTTASDGGLTGEVESVEGDVITIVTPDGERLQVQTTDTTLIEKYITATVADVEPGEQVIAMGSLGDDGTVTAISLQVAPEGRFASGQPQASSRSTGQGQSGQGGGFPQGGVFVQSGPVPGGGAQFTFGQPPAFAQGQDGQGSGRFGQLGQFSGTFTRVTGTVDGIEDDVLVVTDSEGVVTRIATTEETAIEKYAAVTAADLEPGEQVTVSGRENDDGSITARSVQVTPQRPTMRGGFASGTVDALDGDTLALTTAEGEQTTVTLTETTTIMKLASITLADLTPGEPVIVTGPTNEDGSIAAESIQPMQGGGFGGMVQMAQPGGAPPQADATPSAEATPAGGFTLLQGFTFGQVADVEGSTLTITDTNGSLVPVQTTEATTIETYVQATRDDLQPGVQVVVSGSTDDEDHITAFSVQIVPAGRATGEPGE